MANFTYLLKTAYRDSRRDRGKLFLFMSSIVLGIAALVAINSFNYNLVSDINEQAKSLLGADLTISGKQEMSESLRVMADSLPGEKASEIELFSMSFLPKTEESQFVRIKSLAGDFPFYGKLKTEPADIPAEAYQAGNGALVDDGMMLQYGLQIGDSIKLGDTHVTIMGRLQSVFGGAGIGSSFAPTVYIGRETLARSNLVQPGSMLEYVYYYKLPIDFDIQAWKAARIQQYRRESMQVQTVADQKKNLKEAFSSLNYFLNLVALVSLLLGCIGVASSVMIYVKKKLNSIAIFRCLGMKGREAFLIYFIQIVALGLLSVLIGALLGSIIQMVLPIIFRDFLPYEVHMDWSWRAFLEGMVIGLWVTVLFALVPLMAIRNVSPLQTLRSNGDEAPLPRDPWQWVIYALIVVSIFGFLWILTGSAIGALAYCVGLLLAFGLLFGVAIGITWLIRRYFPSHWSFVFRQGLSNLYRPNNQTVTLIVSIGLGTAILTTLFVIQGLLLENVSAMDAGKQPNMILFGIETPQKEKLAQLTREFDMPLIQQVPIVTMKLEAWKGRSKAEWLADSTHQAERWAINREARVSFRDTLNDDEKLLEGTFTGHVQPGDSIYISLSDNYAEALDVNIGDQMIWNVQGAMLTTYVGSLRKINFRSMQTRFFILFPKGVLEKAPQFHVLVTKSPDTETTAKYRGAVVKAFPNVSVVDLGMILVTLNDILSKVSYVIQFMAGFSILTGLIVLISSLFLSKYQRIKESVLLRTLGALRHQIFKINFTEYFLLGALSALTGILIALMGSYILAKFQLELELTINWWPIVIIFCSVVFLTVIIGLLNSREVLNKSPLEILRKETT